MKLILAYNPLPDIKKWAVEKALGYAVPDLNALDAGTDKEKELFDKCTKFFGSFRKHFEQIVPVPAKFGQYNQIYSGAMADLGKNESSREGFFGPNFSLDKVEQSTGNYTDFKDDCGDTGLVGHLNDALGTLTNSTFREAINKPGEFKRKVNAEIQKFGSGSVGIEQFYNDINTLQNSMEKETGVVFEKKIGAGEAWASIGAPVMSQGEYSCYCVRRWVDLNAVAGFSNWCVAQGGLSGRNYFDGDSGREPDKGYIHPNYDENGNPTKYVNDKRNAYYLICKGKKPVALFNISTKDGQKQFKNVGDYPYEMDRPSSKDVVGLALQIRNYLGDSSTSGNFSVFKDYDKIDDDWTPDKEMNESDQLKLFENDAKRADFIKDLNNRYNFLCKNPSLLDKYPDIRAKFVEKLKNNDAWLYVLNGDPSLIDRHPDIREMFRRQLEQASTRVFEVLKNSPYLVEKYPDIRAALVEKLKDGSGFSIVMNDPSLIDRHPDIMEMFKRQLEIGTVYGILEKYPSAIEKHPDVREIFLRKLEDGNGSGNSVLASNPYLIEKYPDIRGIFIENLKDGYGLGVLESNPYLIDKYPEIRDVFIENLKEDNGYKVIEKDPSLLERNPDIQAIFIEGFKHKNRYGVLEKDLSLLDRIPEIRDIFIENLKDGYGLGIIYQHPSMVDKYPAVRAVFVEKLKETSRYNMLKNDPSLIDRYPEIREVFIEELKNGRYFLALENDPSLIDKYPEIREVFIEQLKNGQGFFVLDKVPSLIDKYQEIREIFIEELKNGQGFYIIKKDPSLASKYPEIQDLIVDGIKDKGGSLDMIKYVSDISFIKSMLDKNPNDGDLRLHVLENCNSNIDESKLYKLCKEFAGKAYEFLDQFFKRYHAMSSSPSFQNDFWSYIESSNYLFEIIRDHHEDVPEDRLLKYVSSEDEDIRWIASKHVKTEADRKASEIARRIYLMEVIPGRIAYNGKQL